MKSPENAQYLQKLQYIVKYRESSGNRHNISYVQIALNNHLFPLALNLCGFLYG